MKTANAINDMIAVYPVPFTTGFTVTSNKAQQAALTNTLGRVLQRIRLSAGTNYIDATKLGSGVYYLTTENGNAQKLVKQ